MDCHNFYNGGLQEDFINVFAQAMNEESYVNCSGQEGGRTYSCGAKASNFKTKEITEKATECVNYLSQNYSVTESLDKRLEVSKKLGQSLNTLAVRIKNSIEGRWWYPILNFFGYQAKAPEAITTLLDSVERETNFLSNRIKERDDPVPKIQHDWGYDVNIHYAKPILTSLLTKLAYKEFVACLDEDSNQIVEDFMKFARLSPDKIDIRVRSQSNCKEEYSEVKFQETCLEQGCAFGEFSAYKPYFKKVKELGFSAAFLQKLQKDPSFENIKTGSMSEEFKKDVQLIVGEMKKALTEANVAA